MRDCMPCNISVNHFQTVLSILTLCKQKCVPGHWQFSFWFIDSAACATEVFKIASRWACVLVSRMLKIYLNNKGLFNDLNYCICSAFIPLNNYMVFNDVDGLYTYTFEAERKVCPWIPPIILFATGIKLVFFCQICFSFTCDAGKLFSLQPSTSGHALFSNFQTPGGVGLPDWECLSVSLLWYIVNDYTLPFDSSSVYGYILTKCLTFSSALRIDFNNQL